MKPQWITSRFALGWIGRRALLLRTDPEIPPGSTFVGMLQGLPHPEREWVRDSAQVSAVAYPAELDITKPVQRQLLGIAAAVFSAGALGIWIWRLRTWSAPERAAAAPDHSPSRLEVPPPRSDDLAAAVARKHAPLYAFALYFVLYAMLVMALPGAAVATYLEPQFWTLSSTVRQLEMFAAGLALSAPLTALPFVWWMRRRRAALERLVRDAALHDGVVVAATVEGAQTIWPYTVVDVAASIDGQPRRYRGHVRGVPSWVGPRAAVRVLTTPTGWRSIVIAPTGDEFAAKRR